MSRLIRAAAACLLLAAAARGHTGQEPAATASAKRPFVPTSAYAVRHIRGWTVRVNRALLKDRKDLGGPTLDLLDAKLFEIVRAVPPRAVEQLRRVPIWLGVDDGHAPCAEYHPSRQWLKDNGYNPDKAKCVEIGNALRFIAWSKDQPSMILHELAHAYHDQVLGFDNAEVVAAYEQARRAGIYEAVLYLNGRTQRHYALTDAKEYFAELTESFFGTNDFYPFVRAELKVHDPAGYGLIARMWGANQ